MSMRTVRALAAMALAVAIVALSISSGYSKDDDEDEKATKEAQGDVLKLADAIAGGQGNVKQQAAAIHKKYEELKPVMNIFKPRGKGGIGVGAEAKADGIELRIKSWGKRPPSRMDLQKYAEEIARAGKVAKAVAEVADLYAPKKNPEGWKKYNQDMRDAADEWVKAARAGDVQKFRKASNDLDASCAGCHGDYRD